MKNLGGLLSVLFLAFSCTSASTKSEDEKTNGLLTNTTIELDASVGLALLQKNCYACHNPKAESHDSMLAPPLAGIKNRYQMTYQTRNEFIQAMTSFISEPSEEKALMKGPIRRFGLMPKPPLTDTLQINALVRFIYDHPIESPEWFAEHVEKKHNESSDLK